MMEPMIFRIAALIVAMFLASAAWAQEQAFTNRSTELKDAASPSAKTLSSLPDSTSVKVLARSGGWTKVEANGQQGWVNVFHLRFPATVEKSTSSGNPLNSITGFFGGNKDQQKTNIATTGIRGLSPEDLKNANPDPAALALLQSYRVDKPVAERFAKDGKLASAKVDDPSQGAHK
jgi:Bacterial SH3 domain